MNSFVAHHPLPALLAALLLGMILKWVLDLFLLRERLFRLERDLTRRDREIADLRHEHGRVLTDLKNRLTELDATQKSKAVLATTLAARESDLAAARVRLAEVESAERTARGAAQQWEQSSRLHEGELAVARDRVAAQERDLAAAASVHDALQAAVLKRDARVSDADEAARKAAESEEALAKARQELAAAGKARAAVDRELAAAKSAREEAQASATKLQQALAEADQRGSGLQKQLDQALKENARLSKDLTASRAAAEQLELAANTPAAPDPGLVARVDALGSDLAKAREARAAVEAELGAVSESHARLEQELAAARDEVQRLGERLKEQPEELAEVGRDMVMTTMLADLDQLTRERNELAAELASLKAGGGAVPRRAARAPSQAADAVEEFVAACPQHLSDVKGIGAAFETRLYAAGIGSYWELSRLTDRELAVILELDDVQAAQLDCAAIRADAARLAAETGSAGRKWSRDMPDDLEPIEGIGQVFEKRLYDAGICTYAALAASSPEELERLCPGNASRRPDYASWIAQARRRAEEQEG